MSDSESDVELDDWEIEAAVLHSEEKEEEEEDEKEEEEEQVVWNNGRGRGRDYVTP